MEILFEIVGVGLMISVASVGLFYAIARRLGVLGGLLDPYPLVPSDLIVDLEVGDSWDVFKTYKIVVSSGLQEQPQPTTKVLVWALWRYSLRPARVEAPLLTRGVRKTRWQAVTEAGDQ